MNDAVNIPLLRMSDISKSFSGVKVLDKVQLELHSGEILVLAGENGAGKSTLIKILGGVYTDYEGVIEIAGEVFGFRNTPEARAAGISIIHQELSLVGSMNVVENIFLGREISRRLRLDKKLMAGYAEKVLSDMGLNIDVNRPVDTFSVGIQQMIEISRAVAFDARIVVMDEPTSALSAPEVEKLFGIIEKLKTAGCGIIYISHKMEEIYRIADVITVLRDGKLIGSAATASLPQDELIKWMVGRPLDRQFPRQSHNIGEISLEVENLVVSGGVSESDVHVDNVSFYVRSGEILGIAGLQGCGNSELVNGIFGTYGGRAKGMIKADGKTYTPDCPAKSIERGIALLTNDRNANGIVPEMTIVENITLAALDKFSRGGWLRPGAELDCAEKIAGNLHLRARTLLQSADTLSGGNRQKVVIGKWLTTEPKVFLLDEPTRGIDVGAKHEIYELMNQWTAEGIAIILITSEMPELLAMSDRIIVMHYGKVTAEFSRGNATQEKILKAAMGETGND